MNILYCFIWIAEIITHKGVIVFFFFLFDEETGSTVQVPVEDVEGLDEQELEFFFDEKVRKVWHKQEEQWYFSIVDVCEVLAGSNEPRRYWSDLKIKLKNEGSQLYENIVQLKMRASDGKMRSTDVANTEQLLRIIQSIPSKKAEPFKLWLAQVGSDRLDEMADPEQAINRALMYYKRKGYSDAWINQRLKSIEVRKDLTDEWQRSGIKGKEYAILTDEISRSWSDMTTKEYKQYKNLKKENLRDNMSNMELILNMLAEASTTEISKSQNPFGLKQSKEIAQKGGAIARSAREDLERETGGTIITSKNAKDLHKLKEREENNYGIITEKNCYGV